MNDDDFPNWGKPQQPGGFPPMGQFPLIFGGGMPPWGWNQPTQQRQPQHTPNDCPVRVSVAITLLQHFHTKQADRAVPGPMGTTEIRGMELLPVEEKAKAAALGMLMQYFGGNLRPSDWERELDFPPKPSEEDKRTRDQRIGQVSPDGGQMLVECGKCRGQAGLPCRWCDSRGIISVGRNR